MTNQTALQIAESVVSDGFDSFDSFDSELAALLADAERLHVSPVLTGVAADRSAPAPVRERALGRVVVQLSRTAPQPELPRWVTSRIGRTVAA